MEGVKIKKTHYFNTELILALEGGTGGGQRVSQRSRRRTNGGKKEGRAMR